MSGQTVADHIPTHVDPKLVVDFDIYTEDRLREDLHLGWRSVHATAPEIFYTPRNGGHWIIARFDRQSEILRDSEHFSSDELHIPKSGSANKMIPLNLDPPAHAPYRVILMRHFDTKAIAAMREKLRDWANKLIDRVIADGKCDFAESLGAAYPVSIFMEMMGMSLDHFDEYRKIVLEYFSNITAERRNELQDEIIRLSGELFEDRKRQRRDDLASKLVDADIDGRPLTMAELQSMGFVLFLGGLDTVANALTFAFRNLAGNPDLQKRLAASPEKITDFVEESLRRYAVVNQTRIVKKDVDIEGARFRVGDMVLCPLTLAGMDDRKNPSPEQFDIDRQNRQHLTFSIGVHTCVGNILARTEMRVFTEEWLKRIPSFRLADQAHPDWRPGLVMALRHLPLEWPARAAG